MASLLDSNLNCGDKDELSSELKHRDKAEIHNLDFLDSSLNDILEESITNTPTPTNNKKDIWYRQQLIGEKDKKLAIKGNLEKILNMDDKNLNGGYSNIDVEMEIMPNISKDFSRYNKSSLCSWKRIMCNSNNQSSPVVQNNFVHPIKRPSTIPFLAVSCSQKKAIDSDSLCLPQPFGGDTLPPPSPIWIF